MSILGEQLCAVLLADSAVAALVVDRIYPNKLPQEEPVPALVYFIVADKPANSITSDAATVARQARVQVDAYARTYAEVQALAFATSVVLGNLHAPSPGLSADFEVARDLFDQETQLHRVQMEFTVWR